MTELNVTAQIKQPQLDHAVASGMRELASDATMFQDMVTIFAHWLNENKCKGFAKDMGGEWVYYSLAKLEPNNEKRFDTFQQMFAFILEDIST